MVHITELSNLLIPFGLFITVFIVNYYLLLSKTPVLAGGMYDSRIDYSCVQSLFIDLSLLPTCFCAHAQ